MIMPTESHAESPESHFSTALVTAARLPGVRVDRAAYLRSALKRVCSEEQILLAIAETPAKAGVSAEVLDKAANDSIRFETTKVTALSAVSGIPGGLAMLGTVPADLAQTMAHMIRIAQKLAYLYGWPDLFSDDGEEPDDATKSMLILFIGVMFGTGAATEGVKKVADAMAKQAVRKLPQQALTKGFIYPIVKKVATMLGAKMTKDVFAKGVAKFVPVIGGVASGSLTLATFYPMSKKLKATLADSPLAVEEAA
ncbi:hypothetical protein ABID70_002414 [Clavibacter michiganensis]|uniref:EcsC family protein n=1 Tax=Clavibacter michiganensis TaxID=28447 RepID=UPI001DDCE8A3|nr:EcsC family protein [Clavibacter michiganensis]MBP2456890.1 hypothetical protein [Clavibacter michiganensis]MDQ0409460.1 hypothetical protein [Clavibacter michiganensis]